MRECATPPFAADAPRVDDARWRAHDLLRVTRRARADNEPDWVREALVRAPWAVVRRAQAADGFVAVGIRGATRAQRFGTWLHHQDVETICSPEDLLSTSPSDDRAALPAFAALTVLRASPSALDEYTWGPTGSAGFELATGAPTVSASSDLDLLIRMPERPASAAIDALADLLARAAERTGTRVDVQIETPAGGVAFVELAARKPLVLARASDGPRLVEDAWCTP
ncbi:malonate decarboxylase holo-ACP synthase [Paraburkholderia dinghuensis]|uniref:Malonate decarboxylase holo-ACP synthase n=1 Tax=Paraburkholderia dinghuensis TaxID=2305225 RepID=A0A3N6P549_9BURK|nr:malonate decarboxylase holo-ACP synthase [Paraburkholderia dinghuensis]RQH08873.1 malonate decarboxylase holo-ACP synthase [Paraburkholderia dinghuensis]